MTDDLDANPASSGEDGEPAMAPGAGDHPTSNTEASDTGDGPPASEVVRRVVEDSAPEMIEEPGKLIRIAAMTRAMLNEVREAPLDERGLARLREVYEASVEQLCSVLPEELRGELSAVLIPFDTEQPSEAELRVAQAQLIGWLEGLFNGIQAAVMSQQLAARAQLEHMQRQRELAESQSGRGLYL